LQQKEKQARKNSSSKEVEETKIKRDGDKIEKEVLQRDNKEVKELNNLREIEKIKEKISSRKKGSEKDDSINSSNISLMKDLEHNSISSIENKKICPEDFVAHTVLGKGSFGEV